MSLKRTAVILFAALAMFGGLVWYSVKYEHIADVAIDDSDPWAHEFFKQTGYQFMRGRVVQGSRDRIDHWAFVGPDRDKQWFEQYGFKIFLEEENSPKELSSTGFFSDQDKKVPSLTMTHHKVMGFFFYFPDTGLLLNSDDWNADPKDGN